jgi:histidyl-tRNA synthetase
MSSSIDSIRCLPGFREFFPSDFARQRYIVSAWREVARRYGFVEINGPTLEPAALYEKKNSGGEILDQLYRFTDRGGRDVALRPEMTPTLARMAIARAKQERKPVKWFSVANFFRAERQQRGRLREFLQLNCDLLGDDSPGADAEIIALAIDSLRVFGFGPADFVVRLSDRRAWLRFLEEHSVPLALAPDFLSIVDKLEREREEVIEQKLAPFGIRLAQVLDFVQSAGGAAFDPLLAELRARGMENFIEVDLRIVRGLAYYTGVVFEVFDRKKELRAIAGGGRYDHLLASLSEGAVDMPAVGLGIGDVVLGHFIESTPAACAKRDAVIAVDTACEVYVVLAAPEKRAEALMVLQTLRDTGLRADISLVPAKVSKQFAAAEALGARFAIVIGAEWPLVKIKDMSKRTETEVSKEALAEWAATAHAHRL